VLLFGALAQFIGGQDATAGTKAAGYLLAGIVLWHVVYQSQIAQSTGFLEETWTRNLLNVMVTPIREVEYMAGVALFGMLKLVIGSGLTVIGALAFFSFDTTDLGLGLVPIGAVLLVVGWAISFLVVGLILRYGTGAEALAWGVMFVLMPLSGIFYPVDALPAVLQPIAKLLPTTHAFEALRTLVDGGGTDWNAIGIAALSASIFTALALWYCTRMLALFRRRGYITRYT
jgi:ABC-2 type transport system permease protein